METVLVKDIVLMGNEIKFYGSRGSISERSLTQKEIINDMLKQSILYQLHPSDISYGVMAVALLSKGNEFIYHRVSVVDVKDIHSGSVTVLLVDTADMCMTFEIHISHLQQCPDLGYISPINEEFLLADIVPLSGQHCNTLLAFLKALVEGKDLIGTIHKVNGRNYFRPIDPNGTGLLAITLKQCNFVHIVPSFEGFPAPQSLSEVPSLNSFSLPSGDHNKISSPPGFSSRKPCIEKTQSKQQCILPEIDKDLLGIGYQEAAKVIYVENGPYKFSVQFESQRKKRYKLDKEIDTLSKSGFDSCGNINKGNAVIYKKGQDNYYRALIKDFASNKKASVTLIDIGQTMLVDISNLFAMPISLLKYPQLHIKCKLSDLPRPHDKITQKFKEIVKIRNFIAIIENTLSDETEITLLYEQTSVLEALVALDYEGIVLKNNAEVMICNVSKDLLHVQLSENSDLLQALQDDIQENVHLIEHCSLIFPGRACLALFDDDGMWYRAIILKLKDRSVEVQFVDYGNTAEVKYSHVRRIDDHLVQCLPTQAISCVLKDVKCDNIAHALEVTNSKVFRVSVLNYQLFPVLNSQIQVPVVELIESCSNIPIAKLLHSESASANTSTATLLTKQIATISSTLKTRGSSQFQCVSEKENLKGMNKLSKITYVVSSFAFYVIPEENEHALIDLEKSLAAYSDTKYVMTTVSKGQSVAVSFGTSVLNRARVVGINGSNVDLRLLDSGEEKQATLSQLRKTPVSLMNVSPLALKCCLDIGDNRDGQLSCSLKNSIGNNFLVNFIDCDNGIWKVALFNVSKAFSSLDHRSEKDDTSKSKFGNENNWNCSIGNDEPFNPRKKVSGFDRLRTDSRKYNTNGTADGNQKLRQSDENTKFRSSRVSEYDESSSWENMPDNSHKKKYSRSNNVSSWRRSSQEEWNSKDDKAAENNESLECESVSNDYCKKKYSQNDSNSSWRKSSKQDWVSKNNEFDATEKQSWHKDENKDTNTFGNWSIGKSDDRTDHNISWKKDLKNDKPDKDYGDCWGDDSSTSSKSWQNKREIKTFSKKSYSDKNDSYNNREPKSAFKYSSSDKVVNSFQEGSGASSELKNNVLDFDCPVDNLSDWGAAVIDMPEVNVNVDLKCNVTWIISPVEFYFQIVKDYDTYKIKLQKAQKCYALLKKNGKRPNTLPIVGQYVMALYKQDECWYRAAVKSVSGNTVEAFFIDYGNTESVALLDIYPLKEEYYSGIPINAFHCKVMSLQPRNSSWSEESSKLAQDKLYNGQNVSCKLGECLSSENCFTVLSVNVDGNDYIQQLIGLQCADLIDIKESYATQDVLPSNIVVYLSFVDKVADEVLAFVQKDSDTEILEKVETDLQDVKANLNILQNITYGMVCIAQSSEDSSLYRGRVMNINDQEINIYYIDYGNTEVVPCSQIYEIPAKLLQIPPLAYCCSSKSVISAEEILDTYSDKELTVQVMRKEYDKYFVSLLHEDQNIFGESERISSSEVVLKNNLLLCSLGLTTGTHCATVSFVDESGSFWIQLKDMQGSLDDLMNNIATEMESASVPLDEVHCGQFCIAKYSADMAYYRAQIKEFRQNDTALVYYIDYGNSEEIIRESLFVINDTFSSFPPYAVGMELFSGTANEEDKLLLNSMVENDIQISIVMKDNSKYVSSILLENALLLPNLSFYSDNYNFRMKSYPSTYNTATNETIVETNSNNILHCEHIPEPLRLINGEHSVLISFVESNGSLWIQKKDNIDLLDELMDDIANHMTNNSNNVIPLSSIQCCQLCISLFSEDKTYYRAKIKKIADEDNVLVHYIDYGNSELVSRQLVFPLCGAFCHLAPQAVLFALNGCSATENDILLLNELTESDIVIVVATENDISIISKLISEGENFLPKLECYGQGLVFTQVNNSSNSLTVHFTADASSQEKNSSEFNEMHLSKNVFNCDEHVCSEPKQFGITECIKMQPGEGDVLVSFINDDGSVWVQLKDNMNHLDNMMEMLSEKMGDESCSLESITCGAFCVAKLFVDSADMGFYRALVKEVVDNDTILVHYIDYGNSDKISKRFIFELSNEFKHLQPQAILLRISDTHACEEDIAILQELIENDVHINTDIRNNALQITEITVDGVSLLPKLKCLADNRGLDDTDVQGGDETKSYEHSDICISNDVDICEADNGILQGSVIDTTTDNSNNMLKTVFTGTNIAQTKNSDSTEISGHTVTSELRDTNVKIDCGYFQNTTIDSANAANLHSKNENCSITETFTSGVRTILDSDTCSSKTYDNFTSIDVLSDISKVKDEYANDFSSKLTDQSEMMEIKNIESDEKIFSSGECENDRAYQNNGSDLSEMLYQEMLQQISLENVNKDEQNLDEATIYDSKFNIQGIGAEEKTLKEDPEPNLAAENETDQSEVIFSSESYEDSELTDKVLKVLVYEQNVQTISEENETISSKNVEYSDETSVFIESQGGIVESDTEESSLKEISEHISTLNVAKPNSDLNDSFVDDVDHKQIEGELKEIINVELYGEKIELASKESVVKEKKTEIHFDRVVFDNSKISVLEINTEEMILKEIGEELHASALAAGAFINQAVVVTSHEEFDNEPEGKLLSDEFNEGDEEKGLEIVKNLDMICGDGEKSAVDCSAKVKLLNITEELEGSEDKRVEVEENLDLMVHVDDKSREIEIQTEDKLLNITKASEESEGKGREVETSDEMSHSSDSEMRALECKIEDKLLNITRTSAESEDNGNQVEENMNKMNHSSDETKALSRKAIDKLLDITEASAESEYKEMEVKGTLDEMIHSSDSEMRVLDCKIEDKLHSITGTSEESVYKVREVEETLGEMSRSNGDKISALECRTEDKLLSITRASEESEDKRIEVEEKLDEKVHSNDSEARALEYKFYDKLTSIIEHVELSRSGSSDSLGCNSGREFADAVTEFSEEVTSDVFHDAFNTEIIPAVSSHLGLEVGVCFGFVTNIQLTPFTLWIQNCESLKLFDHIKHTKEINNVLSVKVGDICIGLIDEEYCRCKVLSVENMSTSVFLVDFGRSDTINVDKLKCTSSLITSIPALASEFNLPIIIHEGKEEEAARYLMSIAAKSLCVCYNMEEYSKCKDYSLIVSEGLGNLAQLLVDNDYASYLEWMQSIDNAVIDDLCNKLEFALEEKCKFNDCS